MLQVLNLDDLTNIIHSETIPVTGEGYDVMLDVIFPKGQSARLSAAVGKL